MCFCLSRSSSLSLHSVITLSSFFPHFLTFQRHWRLIPLSAGWVRRAMWQRKMSLALNGRVQTEHMHMPCTRASTDNISLCWLYSTFHPFTEDQVLNLMLHIAYTVCSQHEKIHFKRPNLYCFDIIYNINKYNSFVWLSSLLFAFCVAPKKEAARIILIRFFALSQNKDLNCNIYSGNKGVVRIAFLQSTCFRE